jgi:glycine/D-amino acid oxidase-like deaminating enzyme
MLIASHTDKDADFNTLYGLAVAEWRLLETQLEEPLPIQWGGVLNWAEPGERADALLSAHERLKSWGVRVEDLTAEDVGRLVPGATPGPFGAGHFLPEHGALDVMETFKVLVRQAKAVGVNFQTPVEVTGLAIATSGKSVTIMTASGPIQADKVVVAAGAGTPYLAKTAGMQVPLHLVSGTLAYSKPMPLLLHRVLNGPVGSVRQNLDGRIVTGLDYAPGADGEDVSEAYGQMLLKKAAEMVPALSGMELDEMTVGYVPIPDDTLPIVGFCDPETMTIYVATMMSGITMAPLMGRLAATEIMGQLVPILEPYRPGRFTRR